MRQRAQLKNKHAVDHHHGHDSSIFIVKTATPGTGAPFHFCPDHFTDQFRQFAGILRNNVMQMNMNFTTKSGGNRLPVTGSYRN